MGGGSKIRCQISTTSRYSQVSGDDINMPRREMQVQEIQHKPETIPLHCYRSLIVLHGQRHIQLNSCCPLLAHEEPGLQVCTEGGPLAESLHGLQYAPVACDATDIEQKITVRLMMQTVAIQIMTSYRGSSREKTVLSWGKKSAGRGHCKATLVNKWPRRTW